MGGSSSSRWFSGALTCGLKFREPDAKDLKVAAGFSVSLGIITIEVTQTSTKPEIYIGAGPGIGPEVKDHLLRRWLFRMPPIRGATVSFLLLL